MLNIVPINKCAMSQLSLTIYLHYYVEIGNYSKGLFCLCQPIKTTRKQ